MSKNLYEDEIYNIYGIGNKKKEEDIVELIDNEEDKTVLVVANHKDYLSDDSLNIVDRGHSSILKDKNVRYKLVESFIDEVELDEKYDEIYLMNILSSVEFEDHETIVGYYVNNHLNNGGTLYVQDLCIDNVLQYFFSPNQFNDNKVTEDTIKMGLCVIYGGKDYKRRSIIVPSLIAKIFNELGINDVMMQPRNTMVIIKGTKL